jgi:hypothetical protein
MINYFIKTGDKETGPFTFEQLKSKSLPKDALVWYAGLSSWLPAQDVLELKTLFRKKISLPNFAKNKLKKILGGKAFIQDLGKVSY